jgi:sugar phosphate isomerase/epimerase
VSYFRCISSLGCPDLSLEETLGLARQHDVPAVELRCLGGTTDLAAYLSSQYGSPHALAGRLRAAAVRIIGFNTSMRLVGGTALEREQLQALVPWAEALRVPWLRIFDGGKIADAVELGEAAETIRWWRALRRAQGWGTDIMIETHDSLFTTAGIRRFTAANPGTAILWDAHHTWRKGGEDPAVTWRAIRGDVVHVHVKDSVDRPSARHAYTYVLPGDGEFPIGSVLGALRDDGFSGAVSLEWEKLWHPYLPSLHDALATAAVRKWW